MPQLRALKTDEEIALIPLDQPILVELPGGVIANDPPEQENKTGKTSRVEPSDPDAKLLQQQLEAAQAAQQTERDRADKAERDAAEARRLAQEATTRSQSLEGDIITGGLAAAQNELAAAEAELERAGEAGDFKAMAKAQTRIGRASAQVVSLESGAAEIAERVKTPEPRQEQTRQQAPDPMAAIDTNPNLLPAEKVWLKAHPDAVMDQRRNNELGVGYERAIKKGLVRGTPEYLSFLEDFMGYAKSEQRDENNNGSIDVQAPPSRNERGNDGKVQGNRITLSPEQREIAKSMGVSEIEYARQVANFETARKADPDKYR
jgi:hypothetical protein